MAITPLEGEAAKANATPKLNSTVPNITACFFESCPDGKTRSGLFILSSSMSKTSLKTIPPP